MNFLAHIYLSGDSEEVIIGNFIADAVRVKDHASFSPGILKGIKLHYKIDEFTDAHPIVAESKNRLRPTYGKYSSVIVDIFYDHFLAADWSHYSPVPLPVYAVYIYGIMTKNLSSMPPKVQQYLPYLISGNWLTGYATLDGIRSTLEGMSRRARFESGMEKAIDDLRTDYELYEKEFALFFPELQNYVSSINS